MEITDVQIYPVSDKTKVRAYASILFDDEFMVREVKIIEGDNKLFVAMPSKRMKDGTYRDTAHPVNSSLRERIEKAVLEAYQKHVQSGKTSSE